MSKDQVYGALIFLLSLTAAVLYLAVVVGGYMGVPYLKQLQQLAITIPVVLAVLAVLVILMWIGWTMLTTPPLEEIVPPPQETQA